jgi:hypothetical protein
LGYVNHARKSAEGFLIEPGLHLGKGEDDLLGELVGIFLLESVKSFLKFRGVQTVLDGRGRDVQALDDCGSGFALGEKVGNHKVSVV